MPAKDFLDLEEKKNLQKALKEEDYVVKGHGVHHGV